MGAALVKNPHPAKISHASKGQKEKDVSPDFNPAGQSSLTLTFRQKGGNFSGFK